MPVPMSAPSSGPMRACCAATGPMTTPKPSSNCMRPTRRRWRGIASANTSSRRTATTKRPWQPTHLHSHLQPSPRIRLQPSRRGRMHRPCTRTCCHLQRCRSTSPAQPAAWTRTASPSGCNSARNSGRCQPNNLLHGPWPNCCSMLPISQWAGTTSSRSPRPSVGTRWMAPSMPMPCCACASSCMHAGWQTKPMNWRCWPSCAAWAPPALPCPRYASAGAC